MNAHDPVATLAGVLSGFALADVLQLLELGARSGELAVDGGSLGHGTVRLRAGRVVAVTDGARAIAAADAQIASIAQMLDWAAGRWAFHASDASHADGAAADDLAITAILVDAARRRDERARRARHPAPARPDVPELADGDADGGDPTSDRLAAGDLQVLAAVDGSRDVPAIAAISRRDVAQVAVTIDRLRALGILRGSPAFAVAPA